MDSHRFDRLTRSLAAGSSRRSLVASALGGALAVAFGRSGAAAGNSDCAHFCTAVYPPGSARGKCTSNAAKHVPGNLCEACGADPSRVCSGSDGAKTCCAENESCVDGSCQAVGCPADGCGVVTIAPGVNIAPFCCNDRCGIGTTQPCVPGSSVATCCGGDEQCVASTSPFTGFVCCGGGGAQCSSDQPCCDGFDCLLDENGNPNCVINNGGT